MTIKAGMRGLVAVAAFLTFCGGSATGARAELASSVWPMFQHDARHTGQSELNGPSSPNVKWRYKGRTRLLSAPSVGADGTVYLGNGKSPLCAIAPSSGQEIWCSTNGRGGDAGQSTPAVSAAGRVYMGARDNDLWAVDLDGTVLWRYSVNFDGDVTTPPAIAPDGTIYMASNALGLGWLFALNPDGSVKWDLKNGIGILNASPAIDPDGNVYIGLLASTVRKFSPSGEILWTSRVSRRNSSKRQPNHSPALGADGTVYFGSRNGLVAMNGQTGEELWSIDTDGRVESAPAIGNDGTIYFSEWTPRGGGLFYAVSPQGQVKWTFETNDPFVNAQAALGADGTIYVPSGRTLYALSKTGKKVWEFSTAGGQFLSGPVIGAPGVIYIASTDNYLYAIGD